MKYKAGFIGAGNMGGALLRASAAAVGAENTAVFDIDKEKADRLIHSVGANGAQSAAELAGECDYLFLAVKPNIIEKVCAQICGNLSDSCVIVTMAAGVALDRVAAACKSDRVIRIMPNTPAAIGEGMILYCAAGGVSERDISGFCDVMSKAGRLDRIDEKLIDAGAALSGCGPAFVYIFMEALADGAVSCGLPRRQAELYAKQTVFGAAKLALGTDRHLGALKDEVCSPGGTTIEGVMELEKSAFRAAAAGAVRAAYDKTSKL